MTFVNTMNKIIQDFLILPIDTMWYQYIPWYWNIFITFCCSNQNKQTTCYIKAVDCKLCYSLQVDCRYAPLSSPCIQAEGARVIIGEGVIQRDWVNHATVLNACAWKWLIWQPFRFHWPKQVTWSSHSLGVSVCTGNLNLSYHFGK